MNTSNPHYGDQVESVLSGNPDAIKVSGTGANPHAGSGTGPEPIMQYFEYGHLPPHLRDVSSHFHNLALMIVTGLPRNPERTVALRKLLESKDAAVRAALAR